MPEEPNSSDSPTPPEETAELTQAEWTDDSGDQTLEAATAEDITAATATDEWDESTQVQDAVTESTEAEWTDNSSHQTLETPAAVTDTTSPTTDEWDEATPEPDDSAEFSEAEWMDDSGAQTLEVPIAEDLTVSSSADAWDESTQAQDVAAESTEAEWTDDSSYQTLKAPATETTKDLSATDEWDEATQEWDDELAELPEPEPQPTTTREALSWIQPAWQQFRRVWQRLIAGVRNRIPAAAKLSDSALSGILVGILVLLLILLNSVRQPSVASSALPAAPLNPEPPIASPTENAPSPAPAGDETTEPLLQPTPQPSPEVPALEPGDVDVDRIAQIQTQMTDSSILNAQRVVDSVQADFRQNQLTLVLNGDWYRLSDYDQTQLAQALMQQSQGLEFTDLEFVTPEGDLLARSPVVGSNMVILQREQPPEVPEPERPRYRLLIDR